jgi:hypothetical protein
MFYISHRLRAPGGGHTKKEKSPDLRPQKAATQGAALVVHEMGDALQTEYR